MDLMGRFRPTKEIILILLKFVRGEGTKDQLMIGDKMKGITDSILPDKPSIRANKIVQP